MGMQAVSAPITALVTWLYRLPGRNSFSFVFSLSLLLSPSLLFLTFFLAVFFFFFYLTAFLKPCRDGEILR